MQIGEDLLRPSKKLRALGEEAPEALLLPGVDVVDEYGDTLDGGFGLDIHSPLANSSDCILHMFSAQFSSPDLGDKQYGSQLREVHHAAELPALLPSPLPPVNATAPPAPPLDSGGASNPRAAARTSPPALIPTTLEAVATTGGPQMASVPAVGAFIPTPNVPAPHPALHRPLPTVDDSLTVPQPLEAGRRSPADADPLSLPHQPHTHHHSTALELRANADSQAQPSRSWSDAAQSHLRTEDALGSSRQPQHGAPACDAGRTTSGSRTAAPATKMTSSQPGGGGGTEGVASVLAVAGGPAASLSGAPAGAGGVWPEAGRSGRGGGEAMGQPARMCPDRPLGPTGSAAPRPSTAAAAASRRSLLLRVFEGLLRPEVAPLAVAAAQRACVTDPAVPAGLYFHAARQLPAATAAASAAASSTAAAGGGSGTAGGGKRSVKAGAGAGMTLAADPFKRLYPEANAELLAALYGTQRLRQRVRVEPIRDRCHPCFRNPFEGLAGVAERRKLVAAEPISDGSLLGPYVGELRSGRLDDRLVGGDLSGVEGLKAAFTLTLVTDLELPQPPPASSSAAQPPLTSSLSGGARAGDGSTAAGPDCLVVVGDPATCNLAEANAPKFWGPCSSLPKDAVGVGNRAACNCRAYEDRKANAAVIPCVFKVRLGRLRAAVEAEVEGREELRKGLEVLRKAAAAVTATGSAGLGDGDAYVYGIVPVVVTSAKLQGGEEVLLPWDNDESFFPVADQNLRQCLHIHKITSERDEADRKHVDSMRKLAVLRTAHKEAQTAREMAVQQRDEVVRQHEDVNRRLAEAVQERDEVVRQQNEAVREQNEVIRQRDEAVRELGEAIQQRDKAVRQMDEAVRQAGEVLRQRDEALQLKDEAVRQRDEAVRQLKEAQEQLRNNIAAAAADIRGRQAECAPPQPHLHAHPHPPLAQHYSPTAQRWQEPLPAGQEPLPGPGLRQQGPGACGGGDGDGSSISTTYALQPRLSGRLEPSPSRPSYEPCVVVPVPDPAPLPAEAQDPFSREAFRRQPPLTIAPQQAVSLSVPSLDAAGADGQPCRGGRAGTPGPGVATVGDVLASFAMAGGDDSLERRLGGGGGASTLASVLAGGGFGSGIGGGGDGGGYAAGSHPGPATLLRRYEEGRRLADEAVWGMAAALMTGGGRAESLEAPVITGGWGSVFEIKTEEEPAARRIGPQVVRAAQGCTAATATAVREAGESRWRFSQPGIGSEGSDVRELQRCPPAPGAAGSGTD